MLRLLNKLRDVRASNIWKGRMGPPTSKTASNTGKGRVGQKPSPSKKRVGLHVRARIPVYSAQPISLVTVTLIANGLYSIVHNFPDVSFDTGAANPLLHAPPTRASSPIFADHANFLSSD